MKRNLVVALVALMILAGCTKTINTDTAKEELLRTDRQFSIASVESGISTAFNQFMTDSAVLFRPNSLPIEGRKNIRALLAGETSGGELTWDPYFVDVAASGDLGYTIGKWQYSTVDTAGNQVLSTGHYVTIWRKQADGTWKYVFDAGTSDSRDQL